jgi:thymidylate synthase
MIKADIYYKENLRKILEEGYWDKDPRPKYEDGTPARSKFITDVLETYDLSKGEFPIPTLRNTAIKTGIKEIFWIYQIQSNKLEDAHKLGINWWDEWNIGDGTIGERYGFTLKRYNLINNLLHDLKNNPFSRRHIISLYQYENLYNTTGLYPCAYETIWNVRDVDNERYLDMRLIQRSNDYLVSGAINKIQYSALLMMVAGHLGYKVGKFTHYTINLHIYDRHLDALNELLEREPLNKQPLIKLKENKNFYDYSVDDFIIENINDIKKINSPLELAI